MEAYEVFEATYADVQGLLKLARAFSQESPVGSGLDFNLQKAALDIIGYTKNKNDTKCWIAKDVRDGEVVGMFLARAYSPLGVTGKITEDSTIYIAKEHRGQGIRQKLTDAYLEWAKSMVKDKSHIRLTIVSGIHHKKTVSNFQKTGFVPMGTVMTYAGD